MYSNGVFAVSISSIGWKVQEKLYMRVDGFFQWCHRPKLISVGKERSFSGEGRRIDRSCEKPLVNPLGYDFACFCLFVFSVFDLADLWSNCRRHRHSETLGVNWTRDCSEVVASWCGDWWNCEKTAMKWRSCRGYDRK